MNLVNATVIWRVGSICATDFTAWSCGFIYKCTGRAGPPQLKRETEREKPRDRETNPTISYAIKLHNINISYKV